jgi:hypothetical protein
MKKNLIYVQLFFLVLIGNGCTYKNSPNALTPPEGSARIEGSRYFHLYGVVIDSIDGQPLSYTNSAYIPPGNHRVQVTYYLAFSANYSRWVDFKAATGGSYIIKAEVQNQWQIGPSVHYVWIEEAQTGTIVGGTPPSR